MPRAKGGLRVALRRAGATVGVVVVVAGALAGCSSTSAPADGTGSSVAMSSGEPPKAEATYGCGPSDAPQITVVGTNLGDGPVIVQVRAEGKVTDRSTALDGPTVTATFQDLHLPASAYDVGKAEARIVAADDPTRVVASTPVDLRLEGRCG
ncbi:MAG: hypothetical protein U0P45_05135 [Acidimicrobiales bacterium]